MSGIDMALWDIRAKAAGWPLYRLMGGSAHGIPAYAGGIALGYQMRASLAAEAMAQGEAWYRALKLRVGHSPERDIARMEAVRRTVPDGIVLMADANTACTLADARGLIPAMDRLGFAWLEEPFPAHDHRSYAAAKTFGHVPLAAGENHYTRFEFHRVIEDGHISILQPDLSKCGGITEALRIAHLASAWKLPIHPHSSLTGINQAAAIHLLAAIDNGGYFEADVSRDNLYRDKLCSTPWILGTHGQVWPNEALGIGVEVDESVLKAHPPIEGPSYI
jgi:L-alanine-DL-glutamate epimerase-like enolase superfamily enzyme